jgi:hypothetical protein
MDASPDSKKMVLRPDCVGCCLQARNAAAKPGRMAQKLEKQPMFCFETAIKMFFFSTFIYNDYNAVSSYMPGR